VSRDAHVGAEILLYSSLDPIKCVVFVVVKATNKGRSDLFFSALRFGGKIEISYTGWKISSVRFVRCLTRYLAAYSFQTFITHEQKRETIFSHQLSAGSLSVACF
jgi:hypothetical protein